MATSLRRRVFEVMESRRLLAADLPAPASDLVVDTQPNEPNYFIADSFSFAIEREMKESGEKGGTEDINIGVGELQECTVSKSMDMNLDGPDDSARDACFAAEATWSPRVW